jgi:hypothetical protein
MYHRSDVVLRSCSDVRAPSEHRLELACTGVALRGSPPAMSTYLSLAGMPGNLHLLTAGWRFIHAIWRQPTAGDTPGYEAAGIETPIHD